MTTLRLNDRPTAVYRLFDAEDVLLYVGITCNLNERMAHHRAKKAWWPEVDHTTTEWCRGRVLALELEARAIGEEAPRYNIAHSNLRRFPVSEVKPKRLRLTNHMSYEHAAAMLRIPVDLLRKSTEAGRVPHACNKDDVWFTLKHFGQIEALYSEPGPFPWELDKVRRKARKRLREMSCKHAAA